jgi:hypothetical protein
MAVQISTTATLCHFALTLVESGVGAGARVITGPPIKLRNLQQQRAAASFRPAVGGIAESFVQPTGREVSDVDVPVV